MRRRVARADPTMEFAEEQRVQLLQTGVNSIASESNGLTESPANTAATSILTFSLVIKMKRVVQFWQENFVRFCRAYKKLPPRRSNCSTFNKSICQLETGGRAAGVRIKCTRVASNASLGPRPQCKSFGPLERVEQCRVN